ncbi:hypothetical protein PIB30_012660 [Stylosanthes scabra]|uniref:Uncharacterized protein n=1 Tax=Stylosanthes scabra TaxID=79078 RepID=A0ABU6Z2T3_9FABA|nr:hypothetical protein [Stylosanthes scabra]
MRMNINFGSDHDQHLLQSGLLKTNYGDMCDNYFGFQTEAGKSVDPRIMRLLEFIRELYIRRRETFKKMVPERLHEDLVELFKRITTLLTGANKSMRADGRRTLQRSLSAGSSQLKLDRFRVRYVDAGGGGGGGSGGDVQSTSQGGQGDNKPAGSK